MFRLNERVAGIYVITGIRVRKTKANAGFITATLMQGSVRIPCVIWNDTDISADTTDGSFVFVDGMVTEFRNELQLNLDYINKVEPSAVPNADHIVPTAPINVDACFAELVETVHAMQDPDLKKVCQYAVDYLQPSLRRIPAAKSIHHAFVGGLLMHVTMMLQLAKAACNIYTSVPGRENSIDRELLFAGIILHDIGKISEFRCYECGLVADYTAEGRQFGHSILGVKIIDNIARATNAYSYKVEQLKHLLLSHHGSTEFGAAAEPMTLEALLLSLLDSIDSKTEAAIEALLQVKPGNFSEKLYAFGGRQLYKPVDYLAEETASFEEENGANWIDNIDCIEDDMDAY